MISRSPFAVAAASREWGALSNIGRMCPPTAPVASTPDCPYSK